MQILQKTIELLEKVNAKDISVYEFSNTNPFYDYFVVCTVNDRASNSAIGYFNKALKSEIKHIEGKGQTGWLLIDLGDVIVHLFSEEQREFYGFDKRFLELKKTI
ncbi:MAG TPA: ribosome silencing factor [Acholeplasmataceae bacterium]|nr:ribosome silencing factor [Acholeplasmataceae bacterium]